VAGTFKPNKVITREEMFAIKAPFDGETNMGWTVQGCSNRN
jgi:hypothetical protein